MAGPMRRRTGAVSALLILLALSLVPFLAVPAQATTFSLGTILTLPATLRLNFSDQVAITNSTLFMSQPDGSLSIIASSGPEAFQPVDSSNTTFDYTLDGLSGEGNFMLVISWTGVQPPHASSSDTVEFFYTPTKPAFDIELVQPARHLWPNAGFADTYPYNVTVSTSVDARCKYTTTNNLDPATMAWFDIGGNDTPTGIHTLLNQIFSSATLTVWCGNTTNATAQKRFLIGYEVLPPTFTVNVSPAVIVDPGNMTVNLSVESDQEVYCVASGDNQTFGFADSLGFTSDDLAAYLRYPWRTITFLSVPAERTVKQYEVTCIDRAGLSASQIVNFTFDLSATPNIAMTSPGPYTSTGSPLFAVETRRGGYPVPSSWCGLPDGTMLSSTDGINYSTTFSGLSDGAHTYNVTCQLPSGDRVSNLFTFTVDTTGPQGYQLSAPPAICQGEDSFIVNLSQRPDVPPETALAGFNYSLALGTNVKDQGFFSTALFSSSLDTGDEPLGTYSWSVTPYDQAGNAGSVLTASTQLISGSDVSCDRTPPLILVSMSNDTVPVEVNLSCFDDQSNCTDSFNYSTLPINSTSFSGCTYNETGSYDSPLLFSQSVVLCYEGEDNNGNTAGGKYLVTVPGGDQPASHCDDGIKDSGETAIDCGGTCGACADNSTCAANSDCLSGFCDQNTSACVRISCSDNVKNGYETGVDCGGSMCSPCAAGQGCAQDSDCASAFCDQNTSVCGAVSCTNGIKDGYETDVDCGGPTCSACADGQTCNSARDCQSGICTGGSCVAQGTNPGGNNPVPNPIDNQPGVLKTFSTLGLVLLILGLLVMGSSGYWLTLLHQHHVEDEESERSRRLSSAQQSQEMSPAQRYALLQQRQQQLEALRRRHEAMRERAAEKASERTGLLKSFDEGASGTVPAEGKPVASGEKSPSSAESGTSGHQDGFVDLTSSAKRGDGGKPAVPADADKVKDAKRQEPKRDAFSELDSLFAEDEAKKTVKERSATATKGKPPASAAKRERGGAQ